MPSTGNEMHKNARIKVTIQALCTIAAIVLILSGIRWLGTINRWEGFQAGNFVNGYIMGGVFVVCVCGWWLYHMLNRTWKARMRFLLHLFGIVGPLVLSFFFALAVVAAHRNGEFIWGWFFFLSIMAAFTAYWIRLTVKSFREWRELAAENKARKGS